ncbi:Similar to 2-dehydro-3-deoxy-D-gluconate 5-dehydrogenase; acc. no. Q05528 [Pyronema omphalodes CBS 100304]|uniref:Similar to 2-dehydro-3-deoxy-D-gluconate 5-dehydrogenase acc. no. Q05528 n=1 Tax=Pyronema omphalodes (strain CBS 100304) TaxID=1076935 RepID=U4KUV3_PYROM|nr:Similar to 2-dehydro-3-deoxy-D-gluconate 5-dehydrogenase; acc. no. Q05528 [Pyronema omphalodes CBS 100304]
MAAAPRTTTDFTCEGKVALVTGGNRGLGYAFCLALAESGASIAILDIGTPNDTGLSALRALGVKAEFYSCDVSSASSVDTVVKQVAADFGGIDICINAAGIVKDEPFLETSLENIQRTLNVNTIGAFLVAQSCGRVMAEQGKERGGSIIFIATLTSYQATPIQKISIYSASKAALRGLIKPMAMEMAPYGVRVNSISPGYMLTDMTRELEKQQPGLIEGFNKEAMLGRMGKPEELRGVVLLLASQAGSYITGQDFLVEGGVSSW